MNKDKDLTTIFKKLIPIYETGVSEVLANPKEWRSITRGCGIDEGLCYAAQKNLNLMIYERMNSVIGYKVIRYFPCLADNAVEAVDQCLIPRIEFMKNYVKY